MKRVLTTTGLLILFAYTISAEIVRVNFNITMDRQPQQQQLEFAPWLTGLFVVDYFANGSLSFAGKNTSEFQSTICVKPIGGGNFAPINIFNYSSVKDAGTEWRSTPVFMLQPSLSFENEFLGKGNSYMAAKLYLKQTAQTLYFWFLVNLSADGKTFKILKAAYNNNEEDILTENEGIAKPTTSIKNNFKPILKIYPNPAVNFLNIEFAGDYHYNILNVAGSVVSSGFGSNETNVSVAHLPKGIYFISVQHKYGTISRRITIE